MQSILEQAYPCLHKIPFVDSTFIEFDISVIG